MIKFLLLVLALLLSACQPAQVDNLISPTEAYPVEHRQLEPTPTPSPTMMPTGTPTPLPEPSPTPTPNFEICSPLEDETFESLKSIISGPLVIPKNFGDDGGHHGIDFAYYQRGDRLTIEGIEIYAIMSGKTNLTLEDMRPYGYTVLIETPLTDLPEHLQEVLLAGYLPVPEDPHYRLICPEVPLPVVTGEFSVYHLYAHMEVHPAFERGDPITCGQTIGTVGNTGYSDMPHLHLETRLGPSGLDIETMAHYENTNTFEEMGSYCLWRMSGYFQIFDPFILFDSVQ